MDRGPLPSAVDDLRTLLGAARPRLAPVLALATLAALAEVGVTGLVAAALRGVEIPLLGRPDPALVVTLALGALLVRAGLLLASVATSTRLSRVVEHDWRARLLRALVRARPAVARALPPAELEHLVTVQAGQAHAAVLGLASVTTAITSVAVLVGGAVVTQPLGAPLVAMALAGAVGLTRPLRSRARAYAARRNALDADLAIAVDEQLALAREIRVFGVGAATLAALDLHLDRVAKARRRGWLFARWASDLGAGLAPLLVVGLVALASHGDALDARLVAVTWLLVRGAQSANAASAAWHQVVEVLPGARALTGRTLGLEAEAVDDPVVMPSPAPGVVLTHLQAGHGRQARTPPVNLDVQGPGLVVLLGPSGSGKTTLLETVAGLTEPIHGTVRRAGPGPMAASLQPVELLGGTAADEVRYHRPASDDAVRHALAAAGLAHWTLDHPVAPHRVSGGERQRLGLARAFLTRPALLLLDDPTRGLDADHAAALLVTLRTAAREAQVWVATHDESLVPGALAVVRLPGPSEA